MDFFKEMKVDEKYVLTMAKFLIRYYQVSIDSHIKLSHKDVGKIGVKTTRLPFCAVSREKVASGEVLVVKDYCGNKAPYVNPNYFSLKKVKGRE